jgi:hypothetical protein
LSSVEIADSARGHGVTDVDIRHAVRLPMREVTLSSEKLLVIGPDTNGRLLEVVVIDPDEDDPAIIHAMPLRRKSSATSDPPVPLRRPAVTSPPRRPRRTTTTNDDR